MRKLSIWSLLLATMVIGWKPVVAGDPSPSGSRLKIPSEFTPVDTTRLLQSPDPLPLKAELAFSKLKFDRPVELTHAGDGGDRLFLVEQQGTIRVFDNRANASESQLFLDLRDVVLRDHNEEGLLGLAFHPKFRDNGQFYVFYSTRPRSSVIAQFTVSADDPSKADRRSEKRLLQIKKPYGNHNGGSIRFGPDGYLYVGLGDGGDANDPHGNAQNLATLLGSILRIDVDRQDDQKTYAIPKDNPFVDRPDARGEIWAYGLRNVWRLAFDRETGELWAGDVGQDRFEEINLIKRGGNYGWNAREGFHDFQPQSPAKQAKFIEPLAEYFRDEGQSVTGGLVYRGKQLEGYQGAYFYADYVSGIVWTLRQKDGHVAENRRVAETGLQIAAFGEDQLGEMYLCAFDGRIYRLSAAKIDVAAAKQNFPQRLSQTGLFDSVKENIPNPGLIPYELNMPFWSDYAVKDRYIALPEKKSVKFDEREGWQFPVGTVFVKTFWMHRDREKLRDPVRLETRLLVNAAEGWKGYTYVYNDDCSDAVLLEDSLLTSIEVKTAEGVTNQPYYFPSRTDCIACHTKAAGFVLGLSTRQMNHSLDYHGESVNQIELLNRLDVFTEAVETTSEKLEAYPSWLFGNFDRSPDDGHEESTLELPQGDATPLARAWLDVNCATCHQPQGIAPGERDLRYHTPLERMNVFGPKRLHGHFSPPSGAALKPGEPDQSELLLRAAHRGARQMPPLATNVVDPRGLEVLRRWILETKTEGPR